LIRRSQGHAQALIKTGAFTLNLTADRGSQRRAHSADQQGYQMLELLSLRKGHHADQGHVPKSPYGGLDEPELKIIDVFICKLRKKLAAAANGKHHIETVWGHGYVLRDPLGTDHNLGGLTAPRRQSVRGKPWAGLP